MSRNSKKDRRIIEIAVNLKKIIDLMYEINTKRLEAGSINNLLTLKRPTDKGPQDMSVIEVSAYPDGILGRQYVLIGFSLDTQMDNFIAFTEFSRVGRRVQGECPEKTISLVLDSLKKL